MKYKKETVLNNVDKSINVKNITHETPEKNQNQLKKETYYDSLKNPLWQRKRLEIMQRDEFKCSFCNDDKSELDIHHLYYLPNLKAYEYDNDGLVTVCKKCHQILTFELPKISGLIAFGILKSKFDPCIIVDIINRIIKKTIIKDVNK